MTSTISFDGATVAGTSTTGGLEASRDRFKPTDGSDQSQPDKQLLRNVR